MTDRRKRGFAIMSPETQREIARRGGQAAHRKGTAHEFTREEARVAGQRGGRVVSADRLHMSRIGQRGGLTATRTRRLRPTDARSTGEQQDTVATRGSDRAAAEDRQREC